ncbi:DUF1684 domain-containing protein [bacterium]|nr:DUF1684 domain-containing protein [bacterium]
MNYFYLLFFLLISNISLGQLSKAEVLKKRTTHLNELTDSTQNILTQEEILEFEGLDYFNFNSEFQIEATFIKKKGRRFKMPTSTERLPVYRKYGVIQFKINDTLCELEVYQNMGLRKKDGYKDYLFIPFRDGTSRHETYGGGRYLDARIPDNSTLLIDFNLAYNPYCAYSYRYSCPIPPELNTLKINISAGEKIPFGH